MSVAVKSAAWAMLLRIFLFGLYPLRSMYVPLLIFVSIATMTGGNLAAITQNNLKRLLAYSSIAHVGYMLLGLIASDGTNNSTGIVAILVYLLVYTFMNLGAFAVITSLRRRNIIGDEIDDIAGLYFKAPTEAILMLVFLLSLAGIPPLAGFWGKYFIFLALIQTGHYTLAAIGVLYSVVGLYYYMRIANSMLMRQPIDAEPVHTSPAMRLALTITAAGTVRHWPLPQLLHQRGQLVAGIGGRLAAHGAVAAVKGPEVSAVRQLLTIALTFPFVGTINSQEATISVAEAKSLVGIVLRHQGFPSSSQYCEVEPMDKEGEPFVADYFLIWRFL